MRKGDHHENHLDEEQAHWFAIYVKYKREKIVHKFLRDKGIQSFLPLYGVTRRYTRKIREIELPLFSCYLFVKITKAQYIKVLETEHVVKFVKFSNNLIAIPEKEIEIVKRILGESVNLEVEKLTLNKGDKVEIVSGNLIGLVGKLITHEGKHNVLIELNNWGYGLKIKVDRKFLRKAELIPQRL